MEYTEKDWKSGFEQLTKELRGRARIRFLSELMSEYLAEESTPLKPYHVLFIDHLAQFFARTLTSEQLNDFGGLQHFIMRVKPLVLGLTEITEHVYEDFIQAFLDVNHQIALSDEEYAKTSKITGAGILAIGGLGFLIFLLAKQVAPWVAEMLGLF